MPVVSPKYLGWAALWGFVLFAGPQHSAFAQRGVTTVAHQTQAMRDETIEQRIAMLHAELKITPAEETSWQAVAQTMRDNTAAMQKIATDRAAEMKQGMTAIDDLQIYAQFAQAHFEGLKRLITSFQTLYDSMPDAQKKIADQVFQNSHRQDTSSTR